MSLLLRLAPDDDVAIVRQDVAPGDRLGPDLAAFEPIPAGHKTTLRDLPSGAEVHKYGQVIGVTTRAVPAGSHLHTGNLVFVDGGAARAGVIGQGTLPDLPAGLRRTFAGYHRADGRVGTRNSIAVLTTVNCSAGVAKAIARRTDDDVRELTGGRVDGVVALTHGTGCGMANSGPGWDILRRTLTGYARHANIGGLVVVGLGCEINEMTGVLADLDLSPEVPLVSFTIQDAGGTQAAVAQGVGVVREMAGALALAERREAGVEHLVLGLQCGGSDGWSGLTANPALGVASDLLVAAGGTSILGETPEIYGAEMLLMRRAVTQEVSGDLRGRIEWWREYTASLGTTLDGNPSPGNKAGGITTILEKSLGAVAKAGHSPLSAVVGYGEQVPRPGLVFMDTPGYDPVSVTGMIAGGANVLCFTTGRGSVLGSRPAPTLKLATNAHLARTMADDIDIDCSDIVEKGTDVAEVGRRIYDRMIAVASGEPTRSEELGAGQDEIVPWQIGAVL
ncbi:altronate dehydratase family protein [Kineosporia sp. NBRC 101731]|uniref:UxaA family hydrolase n=1 Tax=Kineosporia sp. NBRC 101731 TaxID=3032199 RepID=UPI0024A006CE|nr:altronate dehydratase family protein [Kineosporia sp. NBRC 101731]GLY32592.1 altronate hydrolase [Kineosporia sp. NBRC 101731]